MNIIPDPQVTRFDHQNPEVRSDLDFRVDRGDRQALVRPIIEQQQQQINIKLKKNEKNQKKVVEKTKTRLLHNVCVCVTHFH